MTDKQIADLRWMRIVNDEFGISLFWPTVLKRGPIPECEQLVAAGLADRRHEPEYQEYAGYWITDEGRAALQQTLEA